MSSNNPQCTDTELLRLIAERNEGAFSALYARHAAMLFSVAFRVLEDREEARDVVQAVLLKVLTKATLYRHEKGQPAAWLATMTRNQALDRVRQIKSHRDVRNRYFDHSSDSSGPSYQGERYAQFSDERELLGEAMAALRPDEVQVLELVYFGGLSQTEISSRLAQPLGSVKARIRRALSKLRGVLDHKLQPLGSGSGWPSVSAA